MKISFSATNPCHMFPLAQAVWEEGALGAYYSGYPQWKLQAPAGLPVRTHSWRTLAVYGALRLPERWRPAARRMFLWQDHGFDHWAGRCLEAADFIHGIPGQCLHTFRAARQRGVATVLNHATGPVREWVRILTPEYVRAGLRVEQASPYDAAYFAREDEEYALADWHCAASTTVRAGLVAQGVPPERIWLVGYGAETAVWHPPEVPPHGGPFRIVFAGQVSLRKGIRTLLEALALAGRPEWQADFYGAVLGEAKADLASYHGPTPLQLHGPVAQGTLAEVFRQASVLVLPSLEEGFGLVVPQALACGAPCVVSDQVGARDLVRHRANGSIFPVQDAAALAQELQWWAGHPARVAETFPWHVPARQLIRFSSAALP